VAILGWSEIPIAVFTIGFPAGFLKCLEPWENISAAAQTELSYSDTSRERFGTKGYKSPDKFLTSHHLHFNDYP
jgi:hypothetical protein